MLLDQWQLRAAQLGADAVHLVAAYEVQRGEASAKSQGSTAAGLSVR
jgi:hypothetical protein